jgi:hypothetical protein
MHDADRLRANAEDAEVFSEMARSRLRFTLTTRDALVRKSNDAQRRRVQLLRSSDRLPGGPDPQ